MSVQPFIRCRKMSISLPFYSETLDFNVLKEPDLDLTFFMSKYSLLEREGSRIHLSAHSGDGVFGNVIYIQAENVDFLYKKFIDGGLKLKVKGGITMELVEQT